MLDAIFGNVPQTIESVVGMNESPRYVSGIVGHDLRRLDSLRDSKRNLHE